MKALEDDVSDDPLVDGLTTIFTASGIGTPKEWEQVMHVPEMKAQLEPLLESFVKDDQLLIPVTLQVAGHPMKRRNGCGIGRSKPIGIC